MPQLIQDLHKFALEAKRGVLCISFRTESFPFDNCWESPRRDEVKQWLIDNQIPFEKCCMRGDLLYSGEFYIDIPYDKNNLKYKLLEAYLENPDGTSKISGVKFYYMTLEHAREIDLIPIDDDWV